VIEDGAWHAIWSYEPDGNCFFEVS